LELRWADGVIGTADDTTAANMQRFAELEYRPRIYFGERGPDQWISPFQLAKLYAQTPNAFIEDVPNTYDVAFRNNQRIEEVIWGYYFMGSVTLGPLDVLAGVRLEETYVDGEGAKQNNARRPVLWSTRSRITWRASVARRPAPTTHLIRSTTCTSPGMPPSSFKPAPATPSPLAGRISAASFQASRRSLRRPSPLPTPHCVRSDRKTSTPASNGILAARVLLPRLGLHKDIKDYIREQHGADYWRRFRNSKSAPISSGSISSPRSISAAPRSKAASSVVVTSFHFCRAGPKASRCFGNYTRLTKTEGNFNAGGRRHCLQRVDQPRAETLESWLHLHYARSELYLKLLATSVDELAAEHRHAKIQGPAHGLRRGDPLQFSPRYYAFARCRNVTEAEEGQHFVDGRSTRLGTGGAPPSRLTLAARF